MKVNAGVRLLIADANVGELYLIPVYPNIKYTHLNSDVITQDHHHHHYPNLDLRLKMKQKDQELTQVVQEVPFYKELRILMVGEILT